MKYKPFPPKLFLVMVIIIVIESKLEQHQMKSMEFPKDEDKLVQQHSRLVCSVHLFYHGAMSQVTKVGHQLAT